MQNFLYRWLIFVGLTHFVFGIFFTFVTKTSLMTPYLNNVYSVFLISPTTDIDNFIRSIFQFLGPTIASWGLLLSVVVSFYRNNGTGRDKKIICLAILTWFILDTSISLSQGLLSHLVVNSIVFCAIFPPFIFLKSLAENRYI
ncbi:MAG: hypothetical protein K6L75_04440 [Cellvibrionaceae bacterium]